MDFMFKDCSELTVLNITSFDTSLVNTTESMFSNCKKLESLDLNNFNTSSLTNMANMFSGCSSIISLYLKNFDTSSVKTMENLFNGCSSLISLDLRNFITTSSSKLNNIFLNCNPNLIYCFENKTEINNLISYISTTYGDRYSNNCSMEYFKIVDTNIDTTVTLETTIINEDFISNSQYFEEYFKGSSEITNLNEDNEYIFQSGLTTDSEEFIIRTSEITNINVESETNYQNEASTYLEEYNNRTSEIININISNEMYYKNEPSTNLEEFSEFIKMNSTYLEEFSRTSEVINMGSTYLEESNSRTSIITNINVISETNYQNEVSTYLEEDDTTTNNEPPKLDNELIFKEVIMENKPITTENGTTMHGYNVEDNMDDLVKQFPNLTFIYLGECGEKLKNAYSLSSDAKLLVLIEDKPNSNSKSSINNFDFDVYLENGTQLKDLSACNDVKITVSSNIKDVESVKLEKALEFNDLGYDIYNKSDIFYTDNCVGASENGNDITLNDRMIHFYPNVSICNEGCEYNSVDYENQRFLCDCSIEENSTKNTNEENEEEESYLDYFLSLINYKIIICYRLFFEFSSFYYNAGFYISFSILFIFLILMLIFWTKGMKKLRLIFYKNIPKDDLKKNLDNDVKISQHQDYRRNSKKGITMKFNESSENIVNKDSDQCNKKRVAKKRKTFQKKKNSNPNIRKKKKVMSVKITDKSESESKLNYKKPKIKSKTMFHRGRKSNIYAKEISMETDLQIDFNFEHLIIKNDKDIERRELNEIPFKQALRIDNRSAFQVFLSVLGNKIGLLNLFIYKKKYSNFSLDLSIYLFELLLDLTMNCVLYTDDVVSEKYNNNGEISMFTSLSLSIISNIISSIVVFIISKLVNYVEILEIILKNVRDKKYYFFNILRYMAYIKIRLGFYFFLEIVSTAMMTYYLFIFCSVYHHSQINITINYIVGASISLATSVGLTILITIFRNASFKYKSIYFFNISRYLYEHF
jgi:surface protein